MLEAASSLEPKGLVPVTASKARIAWHLAAYASAGLPLHQGLLADFPELPPSVRLARTEQAARDVRLRLEAGAPLSVALGSSRLFDATDLALVRAGEESGRLAEALDAWSRLLREREAQARGLSELLVYPSVVLMLAILVTWAQLWQALPTFAAIATEAGIEFPWITRVVLALGGYLLILLLLVAAAWPLSWLAHRWTPLGHLGSAVAARVVPGGWGRVARDRCGLLAGVAARLAAGQGADVALRAAAAVASGQGDRDDILRAAAALEAGGELVPSRRRAALLDATTTWHLSHALRSPDPGAAVAALAARERRDWTLAADRRLARLGPALALTIGVVLGGLVTGVVLPAVTSFRWVP